MTAKPASSANETFSRRPWHRLHLSTWLVILLTMGFFVIIEVPGETKLEEIGWGDGGPSGSRAIYAESILHGWPWKYLDRSRSAASDSFENKENAPWLVPRAWKFYEISKSREFTFLYLMLDLIVTAITILVIAFFFEWRRRLRNRWFQFTLRELLLLVLVTAGVLSWWRTHHNQRVRELEIVNRFSEDVPSKGIFCSEEYKGPQILAKVFGTGLLSDFNSYTENLSYSSGDEKEAEECALFLKEFYNLEKITFEHFTYDNGNAFPSDKTLSQISTLKNLRSLEIASARITDSGMKSISHCTKLTNLNLYETPVSSRGVRYLDSTPFLEWLILRKTKIDDTAAETLGRLDNLFYLDVSGTKLTDKSVPYLGRLSHLEHLIISDTDISEKGYRELESMLPNCDIAYK